jgi:hypothetical protein
MDFLLTLACAGAATTTASSTTPTAFHGRWRTLS